MSLTFVFGFIFKLPLATIGLESVHVCQRSSKKFNKPSSQLHPIKVQNTVFHGIGIDLVGLLPETSQGNKYLINCTCYFSKWPEAAALKIKSAEGMDEFYIFSFAQRQKK